MIYDSVCGNIFTRSYKTMHAGWPASAHGAAGPAAGHAGAGGAGGVACKGRLNFLSAAGVVSFIFKAMQPPRLAALGTPPSKGGDYSSKFDFLCKAL